MTSTGADDRAWQMIMRKGDPGYAVKAKRALFSEPGTHLRVANLLDGIRSLSGEKIQWYLAAELRDRIRHTGVRITVIDKIARKQYAVEPRQYEGRLLHQLPNVRCTLGDIYVELYLNEPVETNRVALFRNGTRVFEDISVVGELAKPPWTTRYLQGHIDAPFINLTPGTRSGIVHDAAYVALLDALGPLEEKLVEMLEEQRRAEEEHPVVNFCRQSNVHFGTPSWRYLLKSTIGLIFTRKYNVGQGKVARLTLVSRLQWPRPSQSLATESSGSFSNTLVPCLVWWYRLRRLSCALATEGHCEHCPMIERDDGSNRI
ncbi:MAG TPA: hypothetical protein VLA93_01640 [Pyrinomonadaceae bacterium]|nr:hypothetical protein [Pyrinomonadaceae bacterium]